MVASAGAMGGAQNVAAAGAMGGAQMVAAAGAGGGAQMVAAAGAMGGAQIVLAAGGQMVALGPWGARSYFRRISVRNCGSERRPSKRLERQATRRARLWRAARCRWLRARARSPVKV